MDNYSLADGNASCVQGLDSALLTRVEFLLPTITLGLLNIIVIIGNTLVVAAVFVYRKLRSVTNMFIVSLAIADLLVGVSVLPFSSTNEVLGYWVFGTIWCSIWLAVDVWLCTASILNLCAISLDRYLAITRPFKYHSLMSSTRGRVLIAFVWILSFVICLPPLIGWNDKDTTFSSPVKDREHGYSEVKVANISGIFLSDSRLYVMNVTYPFDGGTVSEKPNATFCKSTHVQCGLTSDPGYIIYSALGSFYIPMCIMVFFYWRIYRAAVRSTSALNRGVLTTKASSELPSVTAEENITLRVHRGRAIPNSISSSSHMGDHVSENSALTPKSKRRAVLQRNTYVVHDGLKSNEHLHGIVRFSKKKSKVRLKLNPRSNNFTILRSNRPPCLEKRHNTPNNKRKTDQPQEIPITENNEHNGTHYKRGTKFAVKVGKINIKTQLRKLNKETKAAKTVGIIVGCFIFCWCPFFTIYLLGAFCTNCTPPMVFSVFFWLGYCNSAANPCIYALFSRDFRYAFMRLLQCSYRQRKRRPRSISALAGSLRTHMYSKESDSISD